MRPVTLIGAAGGVGLVLTCEHASAAVPAEYDGLGLATEQLQDHIGWDIGAAALTRALSRQIGADAVLSGASRLLVDCNRDLGDADLIPHASHGVAVPGNAGVDASERTRRLARFYDPYHAVIDAQLVRRPGVLLMSVHSFTPELNGCAREFDVGVLFDDFADMAASCADRISTAGFAVRMNEPYSGLDGLIFSARSHGRRHGVRYLEIEVNNRLLRSAADVEAVADRLRDAIAGVAAMNAAL